jgi:hypothetical protein
VSEVDGLQPGETAVAYFERLRAKFKTMWDTTGVIAMTQAASVAALAVADRNEPIQRALLEEVRTLNRKLDRMIPFADPLPDAPEV